MNVPLIEPAVLPHGEGRAANPLPGHPPTRYRQESRQLDSLYQPIGNSLTMLEQRITERLATDVAMIGKAAHYLIDAGGKRIRPVILLGFADMLGAPQDHAIELAAVIEFIHSATLLHDDVVDDSHMRRGLVSGNLQFGNPISVLVGDFLYSRAFQMMVRVNQLDVMAILSEATNTIAEGEVMQLLNIGNLSLTLAEYQRTIDCKTAKLFEAAAELAVVLAYPKPSQTMPQTQLTHLRQMACAFGRHLGHAFQLADDALDYVAAPEDSGKEFAHDLREGKITLPLLLALQNPHNLTQADRLRRALTEKDDNTKDIALSAIAAVDGIGQTLRRARIEAAAARDCLRHFPAGLTNQMLADICTFVEQRGF